jgi:GT2 family glycosyltransferase
MAIDPMVADSNRPLSGPAIARATDVLDISILIVSFNTRELTLACLASVYENTRRVSFEVIVVDNASHDGSAQAIREAFPDVQVIDNDTNRGFAAACNSAASGARGSHLLLLNPDTALEDDGISRALDELRRRPDVGALGVRTLYADGTLNPTSCFGPISLWGLFTNATGLSALLSRSPWLNTMDLGGWDRDSDREVATITGCFLMIRSELWRELGGFDERFFMYSEDVDLSARIRARGKKCLFFAGASIVHFGGRSENIRAEKMVKVHGARVQYLRKHWKPLTRRLGVLLIDLGVGLRALGYGLLAFVNPGAGEKRDTWTGVWRARPSWHGPAFAALPVEDPTAEGIHRG